MTIKFRPKDRFRLCECPTVRPELKNRKGVIVKDIGDSYFIVKLDNERQERVYGTREMKRA